MTHKKIIAVFGATGAQGGGLARAIAADKDGPFAARAITRSPDSDKARTLAKMGIEVVSGDTDKPDTLVGALAGAHGAYCVTNFWEHGSAEREGEQATAMAKATKDAELKHVIWSTLEDTRKWFPVNDTRLPTIQGNYKVPHFDSKGVIDRVFAEHAAPTTYMLAAFYWENFIYFGMGPKADEDGNLVLAMPLGGAKLPGIGAEDIGRAAYGVFKRGISTVGQRIGIASESLSGEEMARKMGHALGRPMTFVDVPFDTFRGLGFPGAEDLGNMFEFQALLGDEFQRSRDPNMTRELNPDTKDFDAWLAANATSIQVG